MQVATSALSRRAALTVLISAVGGISLIGGATGILSLNAEPAVDRGQVTLYKNRSAAAARDMPTTFANKGSR